MKRHLAPLMCLAIAACGSAEPGAAAPANTGRIATGIDVSGSNASDADATAANAVAAPAANTSGATDPVAADAPAGEQSDAQINANATAALGDTLVKAHATLDGRAVSGIKAVSTCEAAIVAGGTSTPFRWGEQGNLAARLDGRRQTLRLPADGADAHVLAFDQGSDGDGVVAALGLLAMNCGG